MYTKGQVVLYGMQGVCTVDDIVVKATDAGEVSYYVLTPIFTQTSSIFVPVDNESLAKRMRPVSSVEDVHALIDKMPERKTIWIPDPIARKEEFKRILLTGERDEITALIKTLYEHREAQREKGKKLHLADERYLKEAEKMLYSEFAYVLGKRPDEILVYIENRLEQD